MADEIVMVPVAIGMMKAIQEAMREVAEDLAAELAERYREPLSPTEKRRAERDYAPVYRAMTLVQGIDTQQWAYGPGWKDAKPFDRP
jgi:hypothetical protein